MKIAPFLLSAVVGVSLVASAPAASAQVHYKLRLEPGTESKWEVEASFPNPGGETVDLWMARWTAGAYHVADFGRFVKDVVADDDSGEPLAIEKVDDSHYAIRAGSTERITVRYEAASLSDDTFTKGVIDVESNRIAPGYAFVNPVSLFGFVPELVDEDVVLEVELPEGWRVATALERDEDGRYHAPSFFRFEDSPLLFSPDLHTVEFQVDGKPHAVTVYGKDEAETKELADGCRRIVETTSKLMQGLPYSHYHFLLCFTPHSGGSGLEHSYSTLILLSEGMGAGRGVWDIVAHEFFHTWCAERIHVEGLHRPDYTRPFETGTIWVNEGITEYFTQHILLHAGFLDRDRFLRGLAGSHRLAGRDRKTSWTDVSRAATNWTEGGLMGFVSSMYHTGPTVVFALDLEMRRASNGERGIIDLLRFLRHAYIDRDRGFPEGSMIGVINGIAQADLTAFYRDYIDGTKYPDVKASLEVIGYTRDGRKVVEVDNPSEEQLRAREDFLSIPR